MRVCLAFLALSCVAAAQTPARVEGRVVSTTGEPIRKATVRLILTGQPSRAFIEMSGPDGHFLFENLTAGRYALTSQKPGYSPSATPAANVAITLAAGENRRNLEITLTPLAVVTGRITDADGDPVSNARVQLFRRAYVRGKMVVQMAMAAQSDDRGEYRLINVAPGRYYVGAGETPIGVNPNEVRGPSALESSLPTYHPGSANTSGALLVIAKAGIETSNVDVRLQRGRTRAVRGTVVDENGAPVQAQVSLYQKNDGGAQVTSQAAVRPPNGTFEFRGLAPGDYTLLARSTPASPSPAVKIEAFSGVASPVAVSTPSPANAPVSAARMDINIGGSDIDGLSIRLGKGVEVKGRLRLDGDGDLTLFLRSAAANAPQRDGVAAVAVPTAAPAITISQPVSTQRPSTAIVLQSDESTSSRSAVAEDGTFTIPNLTPSRYTISVAPLAPGSYVKSIRWGSQDVTNAFLDLTAGGSAGTLEILVSPKGAQVSGNVTGNTAGSTVLMWPSTPAAADPQGGIRTFRPETDGSFQAKGLPPGEYYVAAWTDIPADLGRIPDFLDLFRPSATKLKIAEGEAVSIEVKTISADTVQKAVEQFR